MTTKKKWMSLTDKKYPIYMDLIQMATILDMYNSLSSRIWTEKDRRKRLQPIIEEMREVWDTWLLQRNKYIQEQIDKKRNNGSELGQNR